MAYASNGRRDFRRYKGDEEASRNTLIMHITIIDPVIVDNI